MQCSYAYIRPQGAKKAMKSIPEATPRTAITGIVDDVWTIQHLCLSVLPLQVEKVTLEEHGSFGDVLTATEELVTPSCKG